MNQSWSTFLKLKETALSQNVLCGSYMDRVECEPAAGETIRRKHESRAGENAIFSPTTTRCIAPYRTVSRHIAPYRAISFCRYGRAATPGHASRARRTRGRGSDAGGTRTHPLSCQSYSCQATWLYTLSTVRGPCKARATPLSTGLGPASSSARARARPAPPRATPPRAPPARTPGSAASARRRRSSPHQ